MYYNCLQTFNFCNLAKFFMTTTMTISTSLVFCLYMDIRKIKWMNLLPSSFLLIQFISHLSPPFLSLSCPSDQWLSRYSHIGWFYEVIRSNHNQPLTISTFNPVILTSFSLSTYLRMGSKDILKHCIFPTILTLRATTHFFKLHLYIHFLIWVLFLF